jgi:type I restriction enzyme S subunit
MMENNLPESWEIIKLTENLNYLPTGVKAYKGTKKYYSTGSIQENEFTPEGEFTFIDRPARANRITELGDVLQARMKDTDKGILIDEKIEGQLFSTGFLQLRPYGNTYNNKLLYYFLKSELFLQQRNELATGSTQVALTDKGANEIEIPLPPFEEQHRIVAKLDFLIQKVERNKQRLEKIPKLIKRFRQSVLSAAVNGKLTADWREKKRIYKEWEEKKLIDVITDKPKNGYSAKPVNYKTPNKVLTLTATTSGKFIDGHFKYFDEIIDTNSKFWLQPNDILVQRGNTIEYVGVSAIYNGKSHEYIFPDLMMRFRANNEILTIFLYYVLSDERSRNFLRDRATGTAGNMPKINQPTLMSLPINLPTLEEQHEIVRRAENLFAFADKIEARFNKAKAMMDKLPQSILAKAFRGALVPQEANDEPVSMLLQRIKSNKLNLLNEEKVKKSTLTKKSRVKKETNFKDILSYIESIRKPVTQSEILTSVNIDASSYLIQINDLIDKDILLKKHIDSQIFYELKK